jgi:hypothetical protein
LKPRQGPVSGWIVSQQLQARVGRNDFYAPKLAQG